MAAREDQRKDASPPPAPRGSSPTGPQKPRFRVSRRWIVFGLLLLAFNFYFGTRATKPPARVRIPYSPFFLAQVQAGNVKEITSRGAEIQGLFRTRTHTPAGPVAKRFKTLIPSFADTNELSGLLREKRVVVNAESLDGGPFWCNCCSASARRFCCCSC